MHIRIVDPQLLNDKGHGRSKAEHCIAKDCGVATKDGKPYCFKHVDKMPYIQWLKLCVDSDTPGISAVSRKDD